MRGDYCKRYSKVWWIYDREKQLVSLGRLRCKQYKCPYCATVNQRETKQFLLSKLSRMNGEWYFMTLTARGETRGKIESYKQLARGIDVLIKRFNRIFGKVDYVRVYEKHPKSDALHAHFLIKGVTPFVAVTVSRNHKKKYTPSHTRAKKRGFWGLWTLVKKLSHECGMGYIAHIEKVSTGEDGLSNVTRYVTKISAYLTKDAQDIDVKGLRHVQTSRQIGSIKPRRAGNVETGHGIPYSRIPRGYRLIDRDTGEIVTSDYWLENGFYPSMNDRVD